MLTIHFISLVVLPLAIISEGFSTYDLVNNANINDLNMFFRYPLPLKQFHCHHLKRRSNAILDFKNYCKVCLRKIKPFKCLHKRTSASFCVATIVLAVQKSDLSEQVDNLQQQQQCPANPSKPEMNRYILPKHIKPTHYDLLLKPHLESGLYDGEVTVTVDVEKEDNVVYIHNNGLGIQSIKHKGTECDFEIDKKHELIVIKFPETLKVGCANFTIKYFGDMKNRIVGLYQSTYTRSNGEKASIATSKFEPTYARQAFPCFDEPNLKANFTVHIMKPKDSSYIALSNMPESSVEPTPAGDIVHFNTSVKMSTYLACFIVCDFEYRSDVIQPGNIPLRVYATSGSIDKVDYALKIGKSVIEYYLQYFNIEYPLPKLDLIAIPDFVSGAMEHWGLVTFRETALLFDSKLSSTNNQLRVAEVVAHELAHSWFGNLVTMNWWNDLWLNEGFASYIEYKGVDNYHKDWQMLDLFITQTLHPVMLFDSTTASHPIIANVTTPDEITEIFDTITYSKGSSVLRMLEGAVGDKIFQEATTNYLNKHLYGNAVTQSYFEEVQASVGDSIDIFEFMSTYTEQMGYPMITVKSDDKDFILTQTHFLKQNANKGNLKSSKYNYKWTIPVTYITDKNTTHPELQWFKFNQNELRIPKPANAKWVKFNFHQIGYYRVNYDEDHWNTLRDNRDQMSDADKMHLLEDAFSIAEAEQLNYTVPLSLTKYLATEESYFIWHVAIAKFRKIDLLLNGSPVHDKYKKYILSLVQPVYDKHNNWNIQPDDLFLDKLLRASIFAQICKLDHQDAIDKTKELFNEMLVNNNDTIPQDLRALVFQMGVKYGTKEDWNKMWDKFVAEQDANEKIKLMNAITESQDIDILKDLLVRGENPDYVRSQDYFSFLISLSHNPNGTELVWNYVKENWEKLVDRFTLNERYLGRMIPAITAKFTTEEQLKDMEDFFIKYPQAGAGASSRKEAVENVKNNIAWLKKNKADVERWINENYP